MSIQSIAYRTLFLITTTALCLTCGISQGFDELPMSSDVTFTVLNLVKSIQSLCNQSATAHQMELMDLVNDI